MRWHFFDRLPAASRRVDRGGRTLVVALVLLAVVAIVALVAWRWTGTGTLEDNEAREVADRFLTQIREGAADAAWESTTADFKSDEGRESFKAHARAEPALREPLEFAELKEVEVFGLQRWECTYHPPGKADATVRVLIGNEMGTWKVEKITVD